MNGCSALREGELWLYGNPLKSLDLSEWNFWSEAAYWEDDDSDFKSGIQGLYHCPDLIVHFKDGYIHFDETGDHVADNTYDLVLTSFWKPLP